MTSDAAMAFDPPVRAPSSGVGAMLRARRLELGMSQADVASFVKLPVRRIESMENERWTELPDGPYLRGFLKNIARALNLDAGALMEQVDASLIQSRNPDSILVPPVATRGMLPRRSGPAAEHRAGRSLVIGAFAFALVAALIAWSGTESFEHAMSSGRRLVEATTGSTATPVATNPSAATGAPMAKQAEVVDSAAAPVPGGSSDSPKPIVAPVQGSGDVVAANETANALTLHFNEESWVEVRSADGKLLLQRLNPPGTEQTIEGEAPFTLIVGNAKGVALQFRGQAVDLGPYTRDQVARLTLS